MHTKPYLHEAIIKKDIAAALDLINLKETDLNEQDDQGYSPLHAASQLRLVEIVSTLIIRGADVNQVDMWGNPPIWRALGSQIECTKIIELLLNAGADISIINNHGVSVAAHVKRINGHPNYEQLKDYLLKKP